MSEIESTGPDEFPLPDSPRLREIHETISSALLVLAWDTIERKNAAIDKLVAMRKTQREAAANALVQRIVHQQYDVEPNGMMNRAGFRERDLAEWLQRVAGRSTPLTRESIIALVEHITPRACYGLEDDPWFIGPMLRLIESHLAVLTPDEEIKKAIRPVIEALKRKRPTARERELIASLRAHIGDVAPEEVAVQAPAVSWADLVARLEQTIEDATRTSFEHVRRTYSEETIERFAINVRSQGSSPLCLTKERRYRSAVASALESETRDPIEQELAFNRWDCETPDHDKTAWQEIEDVARDMDERLEEKRGSRTSSRDLARAGAKILKKLEKERFFGDGTVRNGFLVSLESEALDDAQWFDVVKRVNPPAVVSWIGQELATRQALHALRMFVADKDKVEPDDCAEITRLAREALASEHPRARQGGVWEMGRSPQPSPEAREALMGGIVDEDPVVRIAAARSLIRLGIEPPNGRAGAEIRSALGNDSPAIRGSGAWAVSDLPGHVPAFLDEILDCARSAEDWIRAGALFAIARADVAPENRVVQAMDRAIHDPCEQVSTLAEAIRLGLEARTSGSYDDLAQASRPSRGHKTNEPLRILARLATRYPGALDALLGVLTGMTAAEASRLPWTEVSGYGFQRILAKFGEPLVPRLVDLLQGVPPHTQAIILGAVANIRPKDEHAVRIGASLLASNDLWVKKAVLHFLRAVGPAVVAAEAVLRERLADEDQSIQSGIARLLERIERVRKGAP